MLNNCLGYKMLRHIFIISTSASSTTASSMYMLFHQQELHFIFCVGYFSQNITNYNGIYMYIYMYMDYTSSFNYMILWLYVIPWFHHDFMRLEILWWEGEIPLFIFCKNLLDHIYQNMFKFSAIIKLHIKVQCCKIAWCCRVLHGMASGKIHCYLFDFGRDGRRWILGIIC